MSGKLLLLLLVAIAVGLSGLAIAWLARARGCAGHSASTDISVSSESVHVGDTVTVTLATRTGNATYVGLGVNRFPKKLGVANLTDSDLEDTADAYAAYLSNPDLFYLYYFARDCTGLEGLTDGNCFSITDEMIPICPQPGDPACSRAVFSERDYIRPGTQRGPNSLLKLRPVIVVLQTPAQ